MGFSFVYYIIIILLTLKSQCSGILVGQMLKITKTRKKVRKKFGGMENNVYLCGENINNLKLQNYASTRFES